MPTEPIIIILDGLAKLFGSVRHSILKQGSRRRAAALLKDPVTVACSCETGQERPRGL